MEKTNEILELASEAGRVLLENGAEIQRVEKSMETIASHYGEKSEKFFVLSNGIFTTGNSYANVEFIPIRGASLDKVVDVSDLTWEIVKKDLSIEEAKYKLKQIESKPTRPFWERMLGAAVGCGSFCVIFGGALTDCLCAFIAGLLVNLFLVLLGSPYLSKALCHICSGALGTALCMLMYNMGLGENLPNMIVGTMILLIPGVAFTNGLRDLANEDYIAGFTRLLDAIMIFFCIALGVCITFIVHSWIFSGMIVLKGTVTDSLTSSFAVQMLAAFLGTSFFSILFGVSRRFCLRTGLVGMLGWCVYLLAFRNAGMSPTISTFFAATFVAFISHFFARMFRCPSTVFLICGIFPLIPGAGVFWSTYYAVSSNLSMALETGFLAVKLTVAIVFGIIIAANVFTVTVPKKVFQDGL